MPNTQTAPQQNPCFSAELERLAAIRHTLEAWEAAEGEKIPQDILATAFLYTAVSCLTEFYGEETALRVVGGLMERMSSGEFGL